MRSVANADRTATDKAAIVYRMTALRLIAISLSMVLGDVHKSHPITSTGNTEPPEGVRKERKHMTKELINRTDYANIYGLYDNNGKPIGTMEMRLAGRDCGTYYYSLCGKYNKKDIRRMFKEAIEK